jgi:acyl transferase domain-containing protein/acyl carrier protein/N-acetylglutamate synthase-like GNAT family acetyltransferase
MKISHYERSFIEAQRQILTFFVPTIPLEKQVKYIVDIGCGDGVFLKQIYSFISQHTLRGQQFKDFPLILIGIDSDEATLRETEKTLMDIPHIVLKGNISEPENLLLNLSNLGINDPENILHVCSYGTHHFPYHSFLFEQNRPPSDSDVQLDSFKKSLGFVELIGVWQAYLQKWAGILQDNPPSLFIGEVHCLNAEMTKNVFAKSERLHFDALHVFSEQCLLDAETFIILAASFNVFNNTKLLASTKTSSFCQVTLNYLGEIPYQIRHAQLEDLSVLQNLEKLCWAKELSMPKKVLISRLKDYPEGQFVLQIEGKVVGVIYSQRIRNQEDLHDANSINVARLHDADAPIVQLLAVNIDPKVQERRLGDQLLEFMLQRCEMIPGIHSVVGVTLCRDFHKQKNIPMAHYIHKRDEWGRIFDPILRFHEVHGASILAPVSGYRSKDNKNEGFGVLVHYDIHKRRRKDIKYNPKSLDEDKNEISKTSLEPSLSNISLSEEKVALFLEDVIKQLLGESNRQHFSKQTPLMEMGLDSADILELSDQLTLNLQTEIEPAFFFQYNSYERILSYLKEHVVHPSKNAPGDEESDSKTDKLSVNKASSYLPKNYGNNDIAIVGMACRLPGEINTVNELWDFLKNGKSAIGPLPEGRWNWPIDIDLENKYPGIDKGGFIKDIANFDASFFRLSPKEMEMICPQQRILLELAWESLEDFGYSAEALSGSKTGVFVGASGSDYRLLLEQHGVNIEAHISTGTSMAVLANRLSYFYNFTGPSIQIDTACSSSLVAVHQAVQALRLGECVQALVGGVNVICHPGNTISYYKAGMLSKDGLCKTFDKNADGYVRSEGAVMLVLKPLQQAVADQDLIHAVIKGTACNHGGQASGLTVPNPDAQAKLIQEGWRNAGITPDLISYIEAHGTGTKLGDPIEIRGLKEAFLKSSNKTLEAFPKNSCAISSLKSNLGHLEAAAGIAGLLKVILSLKHKALAPSINFAKINPQINLKESPFYVTQTYQDWSLPSTHKDGLRRAGVSSFGSGGTNAHTVVEEYRNDPPVKAVSSGLLLFVLSAKNKNRLKAYAAKLLNYLDSQDNNTPGGLESFVYSLQRRQAMDERVAFFVESFSQLKEKLRSLIQDTPIEGGYQGNFKESPEIAQLFSENVQMQQLFHSWLLEGMTEKVAKLWVKGIAIQDWSLFYKLVPTRVSLPNYPFDRKPYWFKENQPLAQTSALCEPHLLCPLLHQNVSHKMEKNWLSLIEEWKYSPLEVDSALWAEKIEEKKTHDVLVISEEINDYEAMKDVFQKIAELSQGNFLDIAYMQINTECQEIDIKQYISDSDQPLAIFLFAPKITKESSIHKQLEFMYTCMQSITKGAAAKPIHFYYCYQEQQLECSLYQEALVGLFRSIMLESVNHRYRSIVYDTKSANDAQVILCVIQEWLWDNTTGKSTIEVPMVRYVEGKRFALQVNENNQYKIDHSPAFKEGKTYLMIGALGSVGELICQELGRRYQAQLVIFSRRSKGEVKEILDRIQSVGASVVYRSVDILDKAALNIAMESLKKEGIVIHGVIHMARQIVEGAFLNKSFQEFSTNISAKTEGTLNIDAVTRKEPLDFFLICSSMAAFGNRGLSDYAYASAFQNAMARNRNHLVEQGKCSGHSLSICWGPWGVDSAFSGERIEALRAHWRHMGMDFIDAASSMKVMEAGLNSPFSAVGLIAVNDKQKTLKALGFEQLTSIESDIIYSKVKEFENGTLTENQFADFLDTLTDSDYSETIQQKIMHAIQQVDRRKELHFNGRPIKIEDNVHKEFNPSLSDELTQTEQKKLATAEMINQPISEEILDGLEKVLKIKKADFDGNQSFQDYGLDSISGMQLATILEKKLKFPIQPHWLIEHPTLNSLTVKLGNCL